MRKLYTPELYPTRIRAAGSGGTAAVFSMGAGAFVLAALFIFTMGEETKGRSLEAISH